MTDEYELALTRLHEEAAGLISLQIIRPHEGAALLLAAANGNGEAQRTVDAILPFLACAEQAGEQGRDCATCGRLLRRTSFSVVIVRPDIPAPERGLVFGVCARCAPAGTLAAIRDRAAEFLGNFWPEGRIIEVSHSAGARQ